ncbi:hypothetical protein F5ESL0260_04905 [Lactobacillus sp. ESL0260]|uniref:hypothetical protein n=1 Tax=Lactobacillus TaxID=1578 RepID=UPI00061B4C2A|nr:MULTISPECIES: hypothetical protein [Lactobacillus]RMC57608.1 hypothetical protein F5ESL0260_04905 [Lactobacillus sp. ESL0260]
MALIILLTLFIMVLLQLTLLRENIFKQIVQFNHYFQAVKVQIYFLVLHKIGAGFNKVFNTKNFICLLTPLTLYELVMLVPKAELPWWKINNNLSKL